LKIKFKVNLYYMGRVVKAGTILEIKDTPENEKWVKLNKDFVEVIKEKPKEPEEPKKIIENPPEVECPFPDCNKKYKTAWGLARHIKRVHGIKDDNEIEVLLKKAGFSI